MSTTPDECRAEIERLGFQVQEIVSGFSCNVHGVKGNSTFSSHGEDRNEVWRVALRSATNLSLNPIERPAE